MFSATFSGDIRELAKGIVNNPVEISVSPENTTAKSVSQCIYPVDKSQKPSLLTHLIHSNNWQQVLIFSKTKHGANRLTTDLVKQGIPAAAIHGNKSQGARTKALAQFKDNKIQVLVATDIAARGIDIVQLPHVVNFDLPNVCEDYVHRIGRTGRAGKDGRAISFVCHAENEQLHAIERFIKLRIPKQVIEGFEPGQALPSSPAKKGKPANLGGHNTGKASPSARKRRRPNQAKSDTSGNKQGNNSPWQKKPTVNNKQRSSQTQ